ncbi:MAG: SH3 domain-containing protein, partial [Xanthobacteraceae bacterium]
TNYPIVTTIPAGAPVNVSGCNAGWCQVAFQGQGGYIIATSLGAPPPRTYPPGYPPPPPPLYPPPYYGPYPYGYGPGPYWRHRGYYGGWHRHW